MQNLGQTRSSHQRNHFLQTPDTFVRAPLPGMQNATAIVHASPACGARFVEYTAEIQAGGMLGPTKLQRFLYVLHGSITVQHAVQHRTLEKGGYVYIPEQTTHTVSAISESQVVVIEKPYELLGGTSKPQFLANDEAAISSQALGGDPALQVRVLLPDTSEFDFAVNTMTYEPGASLAQAEMHVMEHGLLMLEGGGIYRLGDSWYPVSGGDFIWMAPFCPQWFGALGKTRSKYLIYKDWNRHPAYSR